MAINLNESKSVHIDFINNNQSSSMAQKFHMPTQLNILVLILMPSCGGKSVLRKKHDELNIKFRKM
jgi:hypothetical protein